MLHAIADARNPVVAYALISAMLLCVSFYTSISGLVKAEMFPAEVRALGVGLSYAIANAVFGGSAEFVALSFKEAGYETSFYWYVTVMLAIAFLTSLQMPDSRRSGYLQGERHRLTAPAAGLASRNLAIAAALSQQDNPKGQEGRTHALHPSRRALVAGHSRVPPPPRPGPDDESGSGDRRQDRAGQHRSVGSVDRNITGVGQTNRRARRSDRATATTPELRRKSRDLDRKIDTGIFIGCN